ncbi:MAG TPA: DUF1343 domain-containing protein [Verrucomicrobiota bacterium]|nr:DUF1343 domain-containing protein [Verrucomicrobiota bacterium]
MNLSNTRRGYINYLVVVFVVFFIASNEKILGGFNSNKLSEIEYAITNAIFSGQMPGVVIYIGHKQDSFIKAFGHRSVIPEKELMTEDTIFDAASLTKIIATAPSIMLLWERGKIVLDDPVSKYIPEFNGVGRESIKIRHLLTHTSGLRAGIGANPPWNGYDVGIKLACAEKPRTTPGSAFLYSDINFILLGEIVRRVSGLPLNEFAEKEIFKPLKMLDTGFLPPKEKISRIAPTQVTGNKVLRGVVHDPVARNMGGVAGHSGIFTTARDLARFAQMFLNEGELEGIRIFKCETIREMTINQTPSLDIKRGLGWDIDSGYSKPRGKLFPIGSYGHTGFTGTAIWIDSVSKTFWIFLSNRVHPNGNGNVLSLQTKIGTLVAESITDFDFKSGTSLLAGGKTVTSTELPPIDDVVVLNGVDVLKKNNFVQLKGLRIGLITNHTGHDKERKSTVDLLLNAPDVKLKMLFSPEHGLYGNFDEKIKDFIDNKTGLPVYSLYGESKFPIDEQLKDIDALVFDIQDIGCRFYTYISTMKLCMKVAAKNNLKFFVLDRVNPINGDVVEGPVYSGNFSFIAPHSLPLRHGLTVGEIARMINAEDGLKLNLVIVGVSGWKRNQWFDETGLPWTNPSPNMRSLRAAILYPGIGLLESAISVGRGTDTPFEVIGAPYINDVEFAAVLNQCKLNGVRFIPIQFTPVASIFKDTLCKGVSIIITDRDKISPVDVGFTIALTLHHLYPQQFDLKKINTLLLDNKLILAIQENKSLNELKSLWKPALEEFKKRREKYLIY